MIRIAALFDGRLGHEKQTRGIIRALQEKSDVRSSEIFVSRGRLGTTVVGTCRIFLPTSGLSNAEVEGCDLLIGTGTQTHIPLLLYKKRYGIPAVTCMSPAFYLRPYFDVCFVPAHDGLTPGKNIFITMGSPNSSKNNGRHSPQNGLILLGGIDEKSHLWQEDDILTKVNNIVRRHGEINWRITSSPRTPQSTVAKMKKLSGHYNNTSFFPFSETAPGWIEKQYDRSMYVWVTSDSVSMIFESLTAGCRVGILPIHWKKKSSKFKLNESLLFEKKLAISYATWERDNSGWLDKPAINEAQRCAEHILEKWLPKNLQ